MLEILRVYFLVFYAVRIAVFFLRVWPGHFRSAPAEHSSEGPMRWLPMTLIVIDSFLPPLLILFRVGELPGGLFALRWAGFGLSVGSAAVSLWAVETLGRFFVPSTMVVSGQPLVATGPYQFVRHPAYLGDLALWLGAALGTLNAALLLLWPAVVFGLHLQAREEERYRIQRKSSQFLCP